MVVNLRLDMSLDWSKCIVCQQNTVEKLKCPLNQGRRRGSDQCWKNGLSPAGDCRNFRFRLNILLINIFI